LNVQYVPLENKKHSLLHSVHKSYGENTVAGPNYDIIVYNQPQAPQSGNADMEGYKHHYKLL